MTYTLEAATVLFSLMAVSYLVPDEGVRGLGRVLGGFSALTFALFFYQLRSSLVEPEWMRLLCVNFNAAGGSDQMPPLAQLACTGGDAVPVWVIVAMAISGLLGIAMGWHKYMQRNSSPPPSK